MTLWTADLSKHLLPVFSEYSSTKYQLTKLLMGLRSLFNGLIRKTFVNHTLFVYQRRSSCSSWCCRQFRVKFMSSALVTLQIITHLRFTPVGNHLKGGSLQTYFYRFWLGFFTENQLRKLLMELRVIFNGYLHEKKSKKLPMICRLKTWLITPVTHAKQL